MRRLPYNLLVGAAGFITCAVCLVTGFLCEHFLGDPFGLPDPPIFALLGVLAYGIMANVCYTGGWIAELIVQKLWPAQGEAFGKISFFLGLIFSILLTLAPGALVGVIGGARLIGHFLDRLSDVQLMKEIFLTWWVKKVFSASYLLISILRRAKRSSLFRLYALSVQISFILVHQW